MKTTDLVNYLSKYLQVDKFKDYAPNGLQVEGKQTIRTLVTGVTACQALIDKAIELDADAILVHHGFFWKGENPVLTGMKAKRIKALMQNDINLLGYHLPIDAHNELGNNALLGQKLGLIDVAIDANTPQDLLWTGKLSKPMTPDELAQHIEQVLDRAPLHLAAESSLIETIAWCTGGAQDYIDAAAALQVDAFISGEASERTFHQAAELGVHYFGAGHHATERYGIEALGAHLAQEFNLDWHHVDINNPV
ncbi:Nif3-like dinuclear metal center hexameric protein [Paraferrimonas sp. SM1919]|uniref:Nif3-like dinuclear metal center hexameric protein n=1 Tax=Paraferrimonas sp. SM1919 TaxID=2662263 RepID=UPI001F094D1C|nr:Nif3-like dinuclear metal center hexameric protein [Paraferrimonas sp. SM1919]